MKKSSRELLDLVEGELKDVWEDLVDGAKADVEKFAERMAINVAAAVAAGDQKTVDEIHHQAEALAAAHQVRLRDGAWRLFLKGIHLAIAVL